MRLDPPARGTVPLPTAMAHLREWAAKPIPPRAVSVALPLAAVVFFGSSQIRIPSVGVPVLPLGPQRTATPPNGSDVAALRASALSRQVSFFRPGRNLFAYGSPGIEPRLVASEAVLTSGTGSGRRQAKLPNESLFGLDLLGVFGPEHLRIAVFKNTRDSSILNARVGDRVLGSYIVQAIDLESVLLRKADSPSAAAIRLDLSKAEAR